MDDRRDKMRSREAQQALDVAMLVKDYGGQYRREDYKPLISDGKGDK